MDIRNQKKNEEVRPASNETFSDTNSKYPLASNPTMLPQDMNYKDALHMIEGNNVISPTAAGAAIVIAQKVGKKIITSLASIIGKNILKNIFGDLWPSSGSTVSWEEMMKEVEQLIDQKIEEHVKNDANTALEQIGVAVELYHSALEDWQNTPQDIRSLELVIQRYKHATDYSRISMPKFRQPGYETPLLATYANAANVNLLLYRDMQLYGQQWGIPQSDIDLFQREQEQFTAEYVDHCTKWYNAGLEKIKNSKETSETYAENWLTYHQFRREMTLMVLDIIALFPSYDARLYPIPTTTELTRDLYTDPIGYMGNANFAVPWTQYETGSFADLENAFIRPPHWFNILDSIEINTAKFTLFANDKDYMYGWWGFNLGYRNANDSTLYTTLIGNSTTVKDNIPLSGKDVYKIKSVASGMANYYMAQYAVSNADFSMVDRGTSNTTEYSYTKENTIPSENRETRYSEDELPQEIDDQPDYQGYSHRLSYITLRYGIPTYIWTHKSVDLTNTIYPDKITQIPAVKGSNSKGATAYLTKGPGFTGGDLATIDDVTAYNGNLEIFCQTDPNALGKKYLMRVYYATKAESHVTVFYTEMNNSNSKQFDTPARFPATMETMEPSQYKDFQYVESITPISIDITKFRLSMHIYNANAPLFINRLELIPVDDNYEKRVQLENAQKAVNALFTAGRNALQTDVTDYKVDQVSILVDCVSGELYPNEKRELQNLVKYAKRLSNSRNLLVDPHFTSINSEDVNGWYGSNGIVIGHGNAVFKGNYVQLAGTNDTQYPTYLYQKIDESKLKEYTRYKLRGFIKNSKDLEVYVVRYDAKHETLDVSDNLFSDILPVNVCGEPNRCKLQRYLVDAPTLECSSIQDGILSDAHTFSLNIDTGSIDFNENLGIWVLFKISTSKGYATFGNLEVIEEGPVIGEALARVKRQETKWRTKVEQLRADTQVIYTRAKQAIDVLFTDAQDTRLNLDVTFAQIVAVRKIVQSIREVKMPWFSIIPGINYNMFTELNRRIQQALGLYDLRNTVKNGRFVRGLNNWVVTSDVSVQEEDGNRVLVLSGWDAQVLQQIPVFQNRGYILRVTASKEGLGEGSVTIYDGEGNTDILTFSACDSTDGDQYTSVTGYVTKELEFFPETEKVCIEIGETEGTFKVESVELFLMEELC